MDELLLKIDATGGSVWLTLYHEPEDNTNTGTGKESCEKTQPITCVGTALDWRNVGTDSQTANEIQDFWDWGLNNKKDIVAYDYFDTYLNSTSPTGTWELTGEPLLKFQDILKNDSRVQRINYLK